MDVYDSVVYSACTVAVSGYSGKSEVRELHISFGPQQVVVTPSVFLMKLEVWERWISIIGGEGAAFPCVQWRFNHRLLVVDPCRRGGDARGTECE